DLVVLAVDDTEPLFQVQGAPVAISQNNAAAIAYAGSSSVLGYGFDDVLTDPLRFPNNLPAAPAVITSPMMLFGGPSSAALMTVAPGKLVAGAASAGGGCTELNCGLTTVPIAPATTNVDFFAGNLNFGTVALPARLVQYQIQPVNALGQNT